MFGKIRDKLKNIFKITEEVIEDEEEKQEEIIEEKVEKDKSIENSKKVIKKSKNDSQGKTQENLGGKKKDLEEKNQVNICEVKESEIEEKIKPEEENKPGFFSRIFGKKEDKDEEELEEIEETMLEKVDDEEKKAIKEKKDLSKKTIDENKEKLEKQIEKENELEKEVLEDIDEKIIEDEEEKQEGNFISRAFTKLKSKKITEEDFDRIWIELEIFLLEINIAYDIVEKIGAKLREELIGNSFNRFKLTQKIREVLESEVEEVLKHREADLLKKIVEVKKQDSLVKILILGVNGTGKTTTIAKIVNYFQKNKLSVVVAAADTFRAAAIEQLEEHSKKLNFKLITHRNGSDPAAVAFDAIEHAKAKNLDVVLIDTAGRMPNNSNLMMELSKIKRISQSQISIFIGDSISGNDLIEQIHLFNIGVEIDGVILTKVDTDEKPGSIVTTAYSVDKPIYFLGNGQNYDDLVKFDSKEVAKKLFEISDE